MVSSSVAVAQIFSYLPPGVAHGLGVDASDMVMQYLQPYNTLSSLGYITTLAMAYIPADMVDPLSVALLNPNSALYTNTNPSVQTLMSMIDPSIPVLAGTSMSGGTAVNNAGAAASASATNNENGAPGSSDSGSSAPVQASSVGIGLGVVAGAALYGAAMFYVARRYKKRKASHQRASSVMSGGVRRPGEASTLMAGGLRRSGGSRNYGGAGGRNSRNTDRSENSGRSYISPPVMAENSLGWN